MRARSNLWFFVCSALFFALSGVSMIIDWLGPPMVFAFITLCVVFFVVGAIEVKKADLAARAEHAEADE
jgi:hypothetical protein